MVRIFRVLSFSIFIFSFRDELLIAHDSLTAGCQHIRMSFYGLFHNFAVLHQLFLFSLMLLMQFEKLVFLLAYFIRQSNKLHVFYSFEFYIQVLVDLVGGTFKSLDLLTYQTNLGIFGLNNFLQIVQRQHTLINTLRWGRGRCFCFDFTIIFRDNLSSLLDIFKDVLLYLGIIHNCFLQ